MKTQLLTIISLLIILTSCNHEFSHSIEGNWIGFQRTFVTHVDTAAVNFHMILSIDKDSIQAVNFNYLTHGNRDSLSKSSYVLSDNNFIVLAENESPDTLVIDVLNETTLVLSTPTNKYKYSRLINSKTKIQKIDLAGKIFTISDSIQIIDTIEFLDNNSFLMYNLYSNGIFIEEWRVRQYLGFSLLIIDDPELPVFFVKHNQNSGFELKREPNSSVKWRLKEIKKYDKLKQHQLIGKWNGKSNIPKIDIKFEFDPDSVTMNDLTAGEMIKTDYRLNLNRNMFFIYNRVNYRLMSYRINDIKQDSIILTRLSPPKDSFILTRMK